MKAALLVLLATSPAAADEYGRAGMLELGGSAGLLTDLRSVSIAPSLGWFVAENFEVTGILDVSNITTDDDHTILITSLVEPSYHVPFDRTTFGVLAMGIGYAYLEDHGGALAVAPRVGANFRIRAGVFTPSLSYAMTSHSERVDQMAVRAASGVRLNLGFTAIW